MGSSIVAIGGPHGSGKSSVAKTLSEELEMNYISAGEIFRTLAKENNYTLKEFSKFVIEQPEIDRKIDERTKELGKIPNTIVDAQLAAHFTPDDAAIKICITASPDVRYKRIAKRDNINFEEAKKETIIRETSEQNRFSQLYDIDLNDLSFYDVIINTDRINQKQTYELTKLIVLKTLKWI